MSRPTDRRRRAEIRTRRMAVSRRAIRSVAGDQFTSKIRSGPDPDTAAINCCCDTGRATIDATDSTGSPSASANSTDTADGPDGAIRARTDDAPAACSDTPCQENGTRTPLLSSWSASVATITACKAASKTAGWTPNPAGDTPASPGRDTSAKTSSPRRHIAVKPWNAGP